MGVRCLETFLEKNVKTPRVCISELVAKFKSDRGNTIDEVVIVVDGNSCIRQLYDDDWLLGGEIKRFKVRAESFVDSFTRLGVRLVFYFHEPKIVGLRSPQKQTWFEKQTNKLDGLEELFHQLHLEEYPLPQPKNKKKPVWMNYIASYVFISYGCEVRASNREAGAIAEYARSHRSCLAILGQDTNFVIFQGAEYYFSVKHLIWQVGPGEEITTLCYDRWALARRLNIPAAQLPLLASLCGCDVIKYDDLQDFHKLIRETWRMQKIRHSVPHSKLDRVPVPVVVFEGVAQYIRDRWYTDDTNNLASIASDVFPSAIAGRAEKLKECLEGYGPQSFGTLKSAPNSPSLEEPSAQSLENRESLSSTTDANWENILCQAREQHINGIVTLHNVLNGYGVKESISLEDFWTEDLPLSAPLLLPLRQRIYGILLKERPGGPGVVEEWFIAGLPPQGPTFSVAILPPEDLHPGLLTLWDDDADNVNDIADTRWKLFAHTVSPNLNYQHIMCLTEEGSHLAVPTAVLFYLREAITNTDGSPQYLFDWELEALAIQAALMKSTADPSRLIIPTPYNVRAIQLATIFSRAVSQILTLLVSCGCPIPLAEAMPWLYFDGKLFHKMYVGRKNNQSVESLCINEDGVSVMDDFLKMRNIVLGPS